MALARFSIDEDAFFAADLIRSVCPWATATPDEAVEATSDVVTEIASMGFRLVAAPILDITTQVWVRLAARRAA